MISIPLATGAARVVVPVNFVHDGQMFADVRYGAGQSRRDWTGSPTMSRAYYGSILLQYLPSQVWQAVHQDLVYQPVIDAAVEELIEAHGWGAVDWMRRGLGFNGEDERFTPPINNESELRMLVRLLVQTYLWDEAEQLYDAIRDELQSVVRARGRRQRPSYIESLWLAAPTGGVLRSQPTTPSTISEG